MRKFALEYVGQLKRDTKPLLKRIRERRSEPKRLTPESSFLDYVSIESFDPITELFTTKRSVGFMVKTSHFTGMDHRARAALTSLFQQDIPKRCTVQIINYASPRIGDVIEHWQKNGKQDALFEKLTERRASFLSSGNWRSLHAHHPLILRDFELYLCFSVPKYEDASRKMTILKSKIMEGLRSIESYPVILDDRGLASCMKEWIMPHTGYKKESVAEKKKGFSEYFDSDQEIVMHEDALQIGQFYAATYEVSGFPEEWDLSASVDLIGEVDTGVSIPCPFYITTGFQLHSRADSERRADKFRMIKTQQSDSKLPMFFPKMFEEMQDWRFVSERIHQGERLGKLTMFVVLIASSKEQLAKSKAVLSDHMAKLRFQIEMVKYDTANSFLSTLPFGIGDHWKLLDQLKIPFQMLSGSCLNLMPVFADTQNYQHPLMMFVGRRGQLFFFNNFKTADSVNGNFNMVIVGSSGRGKSVWMQEYTMAILRQEGQVIIIDDGRSFQHTCELLEGDFVDFGGGDFCINPFSLYRDQSSSEGRREYAEYFEEPFIDLIVSILCIVINLDKNNATDPEVGLYRSILSRVVEEVLKKKGSQGGFSDIYDELISNPSLRNKETESIMDQMAYVLEGFTEKGRYGKYFNGPSTLHIEHDFTVFELSELQHNETLQNATLMVVVFLVYAKMQGRNRRTALMIDEFWRLGSHPALKGPIEGFARRGRKYNLSLTLASQCISDFSQSSSKAGAAALAQSDWKILFSVDGKDEGMLRSDLHMSDAEMTIARNLSGLKGVYSECMIRHSCGFWQIGRLLLDPFSAKLYSTKAEDVALIKKMRKAGIPVEEAIEGLL